MFYIALLFLFVAGAYVEWTLNGFRIVHPVSLMFLGLALSCILALVGRGSWNSFDLSARVFLIVTLGAISLLIGSFCAQRIHRVSSKTNDRGRKVIDAAKSVAIWKYVVLALLVLVAIALRVSETYRLASELGADVSSYSSADRAVRAAYAVFNSSAGMQSGKGYSFLSGQFARVESCISYLALFLLARAFVDHNKKELCASFALVLVCLGYVIASGSRGDVLYQGIAFAVMLFVLLVRKGHSAKRLTMRFFLAGSFLGVVLAVAFWLSSALVGRGSGSSFVEYISFYFGCGLPSLESLIEMGNYPQTTLGLRTFYYIFAIPYKFGLIADYPSYSIDWINLGAYGSNIFTGFARYYLDFGVPGMIVLSAISSFVFSSIYRVAENTSGCIAVIMAGYFGAQCFDFAREEYLFSRFASTYSAAWLVVLVLLVFLLFEDMHAFRRGIFRSSDRTMPIA